MKKFLMLAALGAIFGVSFNFFQQPSSNVNQPPSELGAETQPVQQPPLELGAETQHAEEHSELITRIKLVQPPSKPEEGTYNDPCAHGNQCRNDPPTIEKQLEKVGDKLDPSNPDSAPRELGRKLDPTSW